MAAAISPLVSTTLATELVADFIKIRQDAATLTLERASPGKFVETLVQCLQHIARGKYDTKPEVDAYLSKHVESETKLPEDLRICAARIGRAMYTLRNKRNVAHKGAVEPNTIDLAFAHAASSWVLSELLRQASGLTAQEAGDLIALVQAPVGTLVEEIGGTRIVLADVSVRVELLLLLHSHYPDPLSVKDALSSLSRRAATTVRNRLRDLHNEKLAHGSARDGYRLTQSGYQAAVEEIRPCSRLGPYRCRYSKEWPPGRSRRRGRDRSLSGSHVILTAFLALLVARY